MRDALTNRETLPAGAVTAAVPTRARKAKTTKI